MDEEQKQFDRAALEIMTEQELAGLVRLHNRKYWADGEPEISDDDYDAIVRALERVNPANPLLSEVQAPIVAGNGKIIHARPMLSLDKAYSLEEVQAWGKKFVRTPREPLLVQPKYDGISASWNAGILATRGDGEVGENITDKVDLIELEHPSGIVPLSEFHSPARGEIVIRSDDFKTLYSRIRNRNGKLYKNSRNAVAGIMGLKEIEEMKLQHAKLTLVDYSLHSWKTTFASLADDWQAILEKAELLPYPMDGLVVKIADEAYSESLGMTAHHPRGQIAFKFSGVRSQSRIVAVEWSFGKNCLTPVAEIEPVEINGTTIRHATLHNLQNVIEKDLQIGDIVTVERAGDVIPYIVSSEPGADRKPCRITACPSCGAPLKEDLPELRCVNPDCFETRLQRLLSAVRNIGIERLGEPNIRKMMTTLHVRTLNDIFQLSVADLLHLEGFQALSATKLHQEIQNARTVPDWQILASLNIRGIGPNIAKSVMAVHSLPELRALTPEQLSTIDGIGPLRAQELFQELISQKESLDELLRTVQVQEYKNSGGGTPNGTICFTGKMPEKRSFYESLAKEHGCEPVDTVSSALSLLVAFDPEENSSKLVKARKNGVPVVSLSVWLAGLESGSFPVSAASSSPASPGTPPAEPESPGKETRDTDLGVPIQTTFSF